MWEKGKAGRAIGVGRRKGTPNKATTEIRALTRTLFDRNYFAGLKRRMEKGRLPPMLECKLLAYAYGEPKQTVDIPALTEISEALARKVVHEFHPGPTTGASRITGTTGTGLADVAS